MKTLKKPMVSKISIYKSPFYKIICKEKYMYSFTFEITARCNNNCTHCYINLPANSRDAKKEELTFYEAVKLINDAADLGAIKCLLTGGEPLLRNDFEDIYLHMKKKGLLITIFTNATLITQRHIRLFKKYPPRNIEVSVYGITSDTYEKVTNNKNGFREFCRGYSLLKENGINVRLKTIALRDNKNEFKDIARFCFQNTKDYFRFDPFIHLRYDQNQKRNIEIKSERLTPEEIVDIEASDQERIEYWKKITKKADTLTSSYPSDNYLFHCGPGKGSFAISYNGIFRLCPSLWHPDTIYNLREGNLFDAWFNFAPKVLKLCSNNEEFIKKCSSCTLKDVCTWCPAHAYLESGKMDAYVEYFCALTQARINYIKKNTNAVTSIDLKLKSGI